MPTPVFLAKIVNLLHVFFLVTAMSNILHRLVVRPAAA